MKKDRSGHQAVKRALAIHDDFFREMFAPAKPPVVNGDLFDHYRPGLTATSCVIDELADFKPPAFNLGKFKATCDAMIAEDAARRAKNTRSENLLLDALGRSMMISWGRQVGKSQTLANLTYIETLEITVQLLVQGGHTREMAERIVQDIINKVGKEEEPDVDQSPR
jgi:hypothetical protein